MGMSSSQARLLSLTARMHDIEYKAQRIEAQKLQLANDSSRVYEDYIRALDATKVQYKTIQQDGSVTFVDATLARLENGLITGYQGLTSSTSFFLKDTKSGALYITKDYADSIGVTSDSVSFTGTLDQWLTNNNAPTVDKKVVDHYNTITDTTVVNSVQPVSNSGYTTYSPDYYTYENAVENTTEPLTETLVSGKTYSVSTADDLIHLSNLINSGQDTTGVTIVLGSDINMSSASGFNSINGFKGTFNGNGKTISNLNKSLFDTLNSATVSNLQISGSNVSGTDNIGILACVSDGSTISNVKVSGNVNASGSNVGGLIGRVQNSNISKCSFSGTVSGRGAVGGFAGYVSNSQITNCSSIGTVNGKTQSAGFIGVIDGVTISHCSSNETINIRADETTGNPDCGGFVAIANNNYGRVSTISNCSATGTLTDTSTSEHQTIDAGFMGFANQGTTTISNCNSSVNLYTNQVYAVGFAGTWNDHTAALYINNCNYTGNIVSSNSASVGFTHTEPATTGIHTIQITNCYTSSSLPNYTNNGNCTNLGTTWASSPVSNDTSVASPVLSPSAVSSDTISIGSLGGNTATIPSITINTSYGSYNSNILAVFAKSGKFDLKNASSEDLLDMQQSISQYLAQFSDTATDNSKLYYMNEKIVDYLKGSGTDTGLVNALWNDVANCEINATRNYQNGSVINNAQRSTTNNTWTPTHHPVAKGSLTIPNKNTIKANLKAVLAKAGETISDSQIDNFFNKYGSSQQDYAYLAYINDVIKQYSQNGTGLNEIVSAINGGSKIEKNPSYIDDIANYNITMNSTDQSSNIVINYGTKQEPVYKTVTQWDYDNATTKNLIQAYEVQKGGYIIIGDADDAGMDHSTEWLTNMLNNGYAILIEASTINGETKNIETSVQTNTKMQEVADEKELKKAEAKYEADMKRIDMKDRRYDSELAKFETERNAVKQEIDTLKNVAKDNVDRTFKLFS